MYKAILCTVLTLTIPCCDDREARAGIVVEQLTQENNLAMAYIGQSFTTPNVGGHWTNITFSWLGNASTPIANGKLYILDEEYTGSPSELSSATTGYVADSQSVSNGEYVFSTDVTLQSNTQYFAVMAYVNGSPNNGMVTGVRYVTDYNNTGFTGDYYQPGTGGDPPSYENPNENYKKYEAFVGQDRINVDASFRVQGDNVPEPSTAIAMGLLGIVGFAGNRRRRRQESVA